MRSFLFFVFLLAPISITFAAPLCLSDILTGSCQDGPIAVHVNPPSTFSVAGDIKVRRDVSADLDVGNFDSDVPEPVSLLLSAMGLFALGFLRRRK
jgi:hypothetical protein